MSAFDTEILDLLDATKEVFIETREGDRTRSVVIWVVVSGGSPYIRSYLGADGRWYQQALADPAVVLDTGSSRISAHAVHIEDDDTIAKVSDAFRAKYSGKWMETMVVPDVLAYTMRLEPRRVGGNPPASQRADRTPGGGEGRGPAGF